MLIGLFLLPPTVVLDENESKGRHKRILPISTDVEKLVFFSFAKIYIYLFKGKNRNIRKMCEIGSKLTIKSPERRQQRQLRQICRLYPKTPLKRKASEGSLLML